MSEIGPLTKNNVVPFKYRHKMFQLFCQKLFRWLYGCLPTSRTWGTPDSDQKCISLTADYTTPLKAKVYFYGKSENCSPSRFSSTADFLLTEEICPNENPPNFKYIWWKSSKKLSEKFINFWLFHCFTIDILDYC
jgi:hypothetical protein